VICDNCHREHILLCSYSRNAPHWCDRCVTSTHIPYAGDTVGRYTVYPDGTHRAYIWMRVPVFIRLAWQRAARLQLPFADALAQLLQ